VLGSCALAGLVALGAAVGSKHYMRLVVLSLVGFLVPMLIFTNVHIVHNYYQYANGLFLLAAVSFGLTNLAY
jgi:ABC-type transport system involved in cytochrome c biogenesis permease component